MGARAQKPRRRPHLSADTIRAALLERAEDLFHAAFGPPVQTGARDWRARENMALAMCMRGRKRGLWIDHSAEAGGDLMDLVALVYCGLPSARADFQRVLAEAARITGTSGAAALLPRRSQRPNAAAEDARQRAWQAAVLKALIARARPMSGSRSATYLAARGITRWPGEGLNDLPSVPGLPIRSAHLPALVIWARDGDGTICGGQRILLQANGRPAEVEVRKPSFGRISGAPARFAPSGGTGPAPVVLAGAPPLVIAEGPESALSIRQSTGYETWAVFGVSCWRSAPLPTDRDVILAPDRDAPDSPAERAFTRAAAHHLKAGHRFRIAEAPEPEGSKRDLNDTLTRAGDAAVRDAITSARDARQVLQDRKAARRRAKTGDTNEDTHGQT